MENVFQGVEISTMLKLPRFSKWLPEQAVKEDLQSTCSALPNMVSYLMLNIFRVRMTDIEGILIIFKQ